MQGVRSILVVLTTAVLTLVMHQADAQQAQSRLYSLEDVVRIALKKNPELASARLEVERADARVLEAWGTALPSIDVNGQYTRAIKKPVFFLPDFQDPKSGRVVPIEIGLNHSVNMTLTARQILFNAAVITGVGAAKIYSNAAREVYRAKEVETVASVRRAFYGVLLAAEVREMMRATLRNAEENLRNVQTLSKQGLVSEYDELRASVGVENLRPAVIQAENNYALALDALRAAVGLELSEQFDVVGSLRFEPVDDLLLANATELVLQVNSGLKAMRLQLDLGRAYVNVQRSNYLPTLAAFGNYQYQAAKNALTISPNDFIGSSSVGLSISLNVFEGLQTSARVEQAQLELQQRAEQLTGLETSLRTAAHSTVLQIQQARKRVEAQGRTVEQAERGYRIATTRFVSGAGTQLEVNDAQLALTQAQVNRFQALYEYLVASAELDQLLGRLPDYATTELQ